MPQLPRALAVAAAAALVALSAGCAGGRRQAPAPTAAPPAALAALQADAEAAIDSASAKDWSRVSAEVAGIHQAWTSLRPDAASRGARAGLLDAVDGAISSLDHQANALAPTATALAANHLSAYVPDLLALYSSPVPPQLVEMGYLAREIEMDVDNGRLGAVWSDARTLGTQWAYVRPSAQKVDVGDASRLDLQIADLDAAVSAALGGSSAVPAAAAMGASGAGSSSGASSSGAMPSSSASSASSAAWPRSSSSSAVGPRSSASSPAAPPPTAPAPTAVQDTSGASVRTAAAAILETLSAIARAYGGSL